MSADANKAIVRRLTAAMNDQQPEVIADMTTPELAQALTDAYRWAQATYGEMQCQLTDVVAEGDIVMTRYVLRGGHTGAWHGIPCIGSLFAAVRHSSAALEHLACATSMRDAAAAAPFYLSDRF